MIDWLCSRFSRPRGFDGKYARAMALTSEVEEKMRERAASPDPVRAMLADMWFQNHDVALVADAYEASQESRIYKGPT